MQLEHKVEYVEWMDAVATSGWLDKDQDFPLHKCCSVGVLVHEDEERLVLSGTWSKLESEDQVNCVIAIPKSWIVERGTLTIWK